ncbi:hypothetical protein FHS27_006384 [Rhodopirellula rubra]|uniref:Uncharacterized protein n=1 Tax=Aporhodopirellula rubra TaxID=980271 RepID=A0A7W5E678_9BACT|nr:hypothetical protein [Aporhodopirellula rubra]MBB3210537.1 hypothetical protein [Aporhodopirellula rubra]
MEPNSIKHPIVECGFTVSEGDNHQWIIHRQRTIDRCKFILPVFTSSGHFDAKARLGANGIGLDGVEDGLFV